MKINTFKNCAICDLDNLEGNKHDFDILEYECPRCLRVKLFWPDISEIQNCHPDKLWHLSVFCRKQTNCGLEPVVIRGSNVREIIKNVKRPNTLIESQHRILKYFGEKSDLKGSWTKINQYSHLDAVLEHPEEMNYGIINLVEQGDVQIRAAFGNIFKNLEEVIEEFGFPGLEEIIFADLDIRLSPKGREKYDQLLGSRLDSNQVFVAMWFSEKIKSLRDSLIAGIEAAGYDPIIADEVHYTGPIMDFVLASILGSKFIVADFTVEPETVEEKTPSGEAAESSIIGGVRGGVYYEAGFARGLGFEVIHTCKDDHYSKDRLHFDVKQVNTIFWFDKHLTSTSVRPLDKRPGDSSPKNLAEMLHDRIVSIFNYGRSAN